MLRKSKAISLTIIALISSFEFTKPQLYNDSKAFDSFNCNFRHKNDITNVYDEEHQKLLEPLTDTTFKEYYQANKAKINQCQEILNTPPTIFENVARNRFNFAKRHAFNDFASLRNAIDNTILRDNQKVLFDWDTILNKLEKENYLGTDYKTQIVNLFSYLSNYYNKENILRWVLSASISEEASEEIFRGITVYEFYKNLQYVAFSEKAFDQKELTNNYKKDGYTSNDSLVYVFIHEYGHVFDIALTFQPFNLNSGVLPDEKVWNGKIPYLEYWYENYNSNINNDTFINKMADRTAIKPSDELIRFLGIKLGYDSSDFDSYSVDNDRKETKSWIASNMLGYIMSSSNYARQGFKTGYKDKEGNEHQGTIRFGARQELFAELFTKWMLEPIYSERLSVSWNLLNEFFTDYLPNLWKKVIE
ncbi:hypothetical protein [Spiroplasma endosymbiont of Dilophus febrilis]|uniref:hypothetical protein n=1 Tax=Spiroplasma endosymbiont of Dilophus febrilis TaxID=3066292 RepID=UPI00313AA355